MEEKMNCELDILSILRGNSRKQLTEISKNLGVPVSTLYNKIKSFKGGYVKKFTCTLDYNKLGYGVISKILIKINKKDKDNFIDYLIKNPNINSIDKINNGYDFIVEAIFKDLNHAEAFYEEIEIKFKIIKSNVFYVVDKIKEEEFLNKPILIS